MEVAVVRMSNDTSLPPSERRNYKGIGDTATRIIREEGVAVRITNVCVYLLDIYGTIC